MQLIEVAEPCRKRWKTGAVFSVILKSPIPCFVIEISNDSFPPGYALLPHFPRKWCYYFSQSICIALWYARMIRARTICYILWLLFQGCFTAIKMLTSLFHGCFINIESMLKQCFIGALWVFSVKNLFGQKKFAKKILE